MPKQLAYPSWCRTDSIMYCRKRYYQEWGKPAQELNVGDTVYIAPEIKHWHGAAPKSYFVHIAESVPNENASNEWLEAVDEEEYLKLK